MRNESWSSFANELWRSADAENSRGLLPIKNNQCVSDAIIRSHLSRLLSSHAFLRVLLCNAIRLFDEKLEERERKKDQGETEECSRGIVALFQRIVG